MINAIKERVHMLWECQGVASSSVPEGWGKALGRGEAKIKISRDWSKAEDWAVGPV